MRFLCPHCQQPIEVVDDLLVDVAVTCPACGSSVPAPVEVLDTRPMPPERLIGHFRMLEKVGLGQFGEVWKALDLELDRIVAVKLPRQSELTPAELSMFLREARAAARLRHPHIVTVHSVENDRGIPVIISEFVEGPNMADWLSSQSMDARIAASLTATLADALQHAHENGVIHRDLKPSNILVAGSRHLLVTDFGLAKRIGGDAQLTTQGRVLGTPAYMSPEQARGDGHSADARSDVYSLGVILYELLCGVRPFQGSSKMHLIQQVIHEEPKPPRQIQPTVPRDLETICLRALEKDPRLRFQTASAFAADLRRWLAGVPIESRPAGRLEHIVRWTRRNPLRTAVTLLGVVILVLVGDRLRGDRGPANELRQVALEASLPQATAAFIPLNPLDGLPNPDRKIFTSSGGSDKLLRAAVPPGDFLVVVWVGDPQQTNTFHEVYRHVPSREEGPQRDDVPSRRWTTDDSGAIRLALVRLFDLSELEGEMALVPGSDSFQVGLPDQPSIPPHSRQIPTFRIDVREVTVGDVRRLFAGVFPEALRPKADQLRDEFPLVQVDADYALQFAEVLGKRLLDEAEFEFAATNRGQTVTSWSQVAEEMGEWAVGAPGKTGPDTVQFDKPVFGLYSNVAEWTGSWFAHYPANSKWPNVLSPRDVRVVRGGDPQFVGAIGEEQLAEARSVWSLGPRQRLGMPHTASSEFVGFRAGRSIRPRLERKDFAAPRSGDQ